MRNAFTTVEIYDALSLTTPLTFPPQFENVIESLAESGFAVIPGFFTMETVRALFLESETSWKQGVFQAAKVGRGQEGQRNPEMRTDEVHWLDQESLSPCQTVYWSRMESLREAVNRELFLGLFELEAHLARFAPGGFYKPHLDRHRNTNSRILSTIIYLDDNWAESDGGQLRIYTDRIAGVDGPSMDIFPEPGKLVAFLSADFWHEVRLATRPRHSLAGWFRGRESN